MSQATMDNIARLIEVADITQEQLGRIADVSRSAVSHWISGKAEPRMGAISRISDYFGIPMTYIIEEHGMDDVYRTPQGRLEKVAVVVELTGEEEMLIQYYRQSNDKEREAILSVAQILGKDVSFY